MSKACEPMKPREFVERFSIKSLACCFSGGKDSLVATHYTLSELEGMDVQKYVVFVDTTVMVPETVEFVKDVCNQFGWPLKILRPDPDFWTLAEKWGCPTMHRRWCCYNLKLKPIFDFVKSLRPIRAMVTGLRRDESERRKSLPQIFYRKMISAWSFAPIIDWNEKDVLDYMEKNNLPMPPHYKKGIKETCVCGVFANLKQMIIVKALYPEFFNKFVELEGRFKSGGACFYFQNRPVKASDMLKQKTLSEFEIDEQDNGQEG